MHSPTSYLVHITLFPFTGRENNTDSSAVEERILPASVSYGDSESQTIFCARTSSSK
jgi:hypothetical protein